MIWISILLSFCFAGHAPDNGPSADWSYAEKKLVKAGLRHDFIQALKQNYQTRDFDQTVELNLLLFLKKADYHGPQVTPVAVADVRRFMQANQDVLARAEKDHGVSQSVIASLLWIESRHGGVLGDFHVPSVYVHLLQVDRPQVVQHLYDSAHFFSDEPLSKKARAEIAKRSKKKAKWALGELKALQTMYRRDPNLVLRLKGSFAGAFGMPQFIPSSYNHWARAANKKEVPDLLRARDAIYSVAYYLRDSGWRRSRPKSHVKALMRYNNSEDYANAILNLAHQAEGTTPLRRVSTFDGR